MSLLPPASANDAGTVDHCIVVAHRGASGYLPEHTLPAYRLAIQLGADYIEPDLVMTRDGVLVARHESGLAGSTNVAAVPALADLRRRRRAEEREVADWFADDLTLSQLRLLRARETRPALRPGNTAFDGLFGIPTFAEVIALAREEGVRLGRPIGLYPEIKEAGRLRGRGLDPEAALLAALRDAGLDRPDAPVYIQSFEAESLRRMRPHTRLTLVQLIETVPADVAAIARYAQVIGAPKALILGNPQFIARVREAGLALHGWTFRAENAWLGEPFRRGKEPTATGDLLGEIAAARAAGMSGLFTDQPDLGREACRTPQTSAVSYINR